MSTVDQVSTLLQEYVLRSFTEVQYSIVE